MNVLGQGLKRLKEQTIQSPRFSAALLVLMTSFSEACNKTTDTRIADATAFLQQNKRGNIERFAKVAYEKIHSEADKMIIYVPDVHLQDGLGQVTTAGHTSIAVQLETFGIFEELIFQYGKFALVIESSEAKVTPEYLIDLMVYNLASDNPQKKVEAKFVLEKIIGQKNFDLKRKAIIEALSLGYLSSQFAAILLYGNAIQAVPTLTPEQAKKLNIEIIRTKVAQSVQNLALEMNCRSGKRTYGEIVAEYEAQKKVITDPKERECLCYYFALERSIDYGFSKTRLVDAATQETNIALHIEEPVVVIYSGIAHASRTHEILRNGEANYQFYLQNAIEDRKSALDPTYYSSSLAALKEDFKLYSTDTTKCQAAKQ